MRTFRVVAVVAVIGAVCLGLLASEPNAQLGLPAELAGYRDWSPLLKTPYQVPRELAARCMPPTAASRAADREKYGPHTERYIKVFGNKVAFDAVSAAERRAFPPGSVIVKEKLATAESSAAGGVAFMVKHKPPEFADSGGWEFLYFPAGDARGTQESCAACHRGATSKDYVFGLYPK